MKQQTKILYCGTINTRNYFRYFSSDDQAINGLKLLSYKIYGNLTDINKRLPTGWTRIRWY